MRSLLHSMLHMRGVVAKLALAFVAGLMFLSGASAQDKQLIKIGFGMSLTGPLGPNGKSALLAMKIWEEETNKKGGLLGRPVALVFYDDQSNPSTVPGIYTKLLEVDKVDLVMGGYATNMLAPAMPIIMRKKMAFMGLYGVDVNHSFKYDRYFAMIPTGPDAKTALTQGFFDAAMAQSDKPKTVAIVAADAEFSKNAADGARENAKKAGLKVVYDRSYPPTTADFAPIVRAIQATNPDMVVICSYPLDSVGMVQAAHEANLKPKMIGGAMVGLQNTVFKTKLGPLLNGYVNYDFWLPAKSLTFAGTNEFLKTYQDRAGAEGVDPLGYYMGPFSYAYIDVLGQAVTAAGGVDQDKVTDALRKGTFKTIVGDVKFAPNGEWAQSRVLQVQFRNVKGNGVDQFKDPNTQVIVTPDNLKSGEIVYPYEKAKNM
jgi:branched-chain amino acid transport system substrate-binding protein